MTGAAADFIRIPQNPAPPRGEAFYFNAPNGPKDAGPEGARLRGAYFPAETPRGNVVLLSGRCEFIEKYFEVIEDLRARGLNVATMDWRGQGLSARALPDSLRGHIDDFKTYTDDLRLFIETEAAPRFSDGPRLVMTHSMGGLPALRLLGEGYDFFDRAVLCAPMTRLAMPPALQLFARTASSAMTAAGAGGMAIAGVKEDSRAFEGNALTSDPLRHERFRLLQEAEPQACIAAPTYGWLNAAMNAMDDICKPGRLQDLKTPVLIISAENDRLVNSQTHQSLAEAYDLIEAVTVNEALHEILMERDVFRKEYWAHFDRFTAPVLTSGSQDGGVATASS